MHVLAIVIVPNVQTRDATPHVSWTCRKDWDTLFIERSRDTIPAMRTPGLRSLGVISSSITELSVHFAQALFMQDAFDMRKPLPRAAGTRLIKKIGRHLVKVCCWLLAANLRMSCASPLRTLASGFPRKPSTLGRAEALLGFDVEAAQPPLAWTLRTRLQKKVAPAAPATKEKVDKQKRDRAHVGFYLEFVDSLKLQHFVSTGRPVEVEGLGPEV